MVFALDVPSECDAADDVCGCHAAVHAERHVCVGDVLLVGGELADDLGAFEELLGLGEPARDRALIAICVGAASSCCVDSGAAAKLAQLAIDLDAVPGRVREHLLGLTVCELLLAELEDPRVVSRPRAGVRLELR